MPESPKKWLKRVSDKFKTTFSNSKAIIGLERLETINQITAFAKSDRYIKEVQNWIKRHPKTMKSLEHDTKSALYSLYLFNNRVGGQSVDKYLMEFYNKKINLSNDNNASISLVRDELAAIVHTARGLENTIILADSSKKITALLKKSQQFSDEQQSKWEKANDEVAKVLKNNLSRLKKLDVFFKDPSNKSEIMKKPLLKKYYDIFVQGTVFQPPSTMVASGQSKDIVKTLECIPERKAISPEEIQLNIKFAANAIERERRKTIFRKSSKTENLEEDFERMRKMCMVRIAALNQFAVHLNAVILKAYGALAHRTAKLPPIPAGTKKLRSR